VVDDSTWYFSFTICINPHSLW